jgi:hypothetical protein
MFRKLGGGKPIPRLVSSPHLRLQFENRYFKNAPDKKSKLREWAGEELR